MNAEQERERLTARYAALSDGELERIARSGDEFTAVAEQALKAEIARRGLNFAIVKPGSEPVTPPVVLPREDEEPTLGFDRTVTLRRFRDLPAALLAKGSLESAGIEAFVMDDNMIRMDWFISNAIGGLRLQVHEEDVEEAEAILSQPIPDVIQAEGVEDYQQPRCPHCGSLDVSYHDLLSSAFVKDDFVIWTCSACDKSWKGDSDGKPIGETA